MPIINTPPCPLLYVKLAFGIQILGPRTAFRGVGRCAAAGPQPWTGAFRTRPRGAEGRPLAGPGREGARPGSPAAPPPSHCQVACDPVPPAPEPVISNLTEGADPGGLHLACGAFGAAAFPGGGTGLGLVRSRLAEDVRWVVGTSRTSLLAAPRCPSPRTPGLWLCGHESRQACLLPSGARA